MRILCIEDDTELAESICFHLKHVGYNIDCSEDGLEGFELVKTNTYDLVILDRMLPSLDGLSLLKRIRALNLQLPVIMVTALDGIGDRVAGLNSGADDYLVKPFAIEELIARVGALSRRPSQMINTEQIHFADVTLDLLGLCLTGPLRSCSLSKKEGDLAEFFLRHPSEPLTRELLLSKVWGPDTEVEDGNLDNYIHFLRRRLKAVGSELHIKTLRSIGYTLEATYA